MSRDPSVAWTEADRAQLRARGISEQEAGEQLARLAAPHAWADLVRPCTIGDGIEAWDAATVDAHVGRSSGAVADGRVSMFVPASGAATRMFQDAGVAVLGALASADPEHIGGDVTALPKGLVPFHRYPTEVRTAFDEHLVDAAQIARDRDGRCRLHLTVSVQHLEHFSAHLARVRAVYESRFGVRYDMSFSVQDPATDTLALGEDGLPFRDAGGRLLLRPAGHGALLANLGGYGGDIAVLRNIDNVTTDARRGHTHRWARALVGRLLELEPGAGRPVRVAGMVRNTGEPGGGPFWVRGRDGRVTPQIVESAQVGPDDASRAAWNRATHFNPVFLAVSLRDRDGRPWDLPRFVDPETSIVTRKSVGGRTLAALERPGLWNGAMAGWTTVFVEVPLEVFNPVKTVADLLRPEHRP